MSCFFPACVRLDVTCFKIMLSSSNRNPHVAVKILYKKLIQVKMFFCDLPTVYCEKCFFGKNKSCGSPTTMSPTNLKVVPIDSTSKVTSRKVIKMRGHRYICREIKVNVYKKCHLRLLGQSKCMFSSPYFAPDCLLFFDKTFVHFLSFIAFQICFVFQT